MRVEIVRGRSAAAIAADGRHKFDPTTGEDELAFANASLVPTATPDRDPKNPASWGKIAATRIVPAAQAEVQALPRQYA